jgi:two-component system sensor kinase FixL
MIAAACLTMALPHGIIWVQQRKASVHLLFALAAVAVAVIAAFELAIMKSRTPAEIGQLMQWAHVPVFVLVVTIFAFVQLYFGTGRLWLGATACVVRLVSLGLNFAMPPTLTHREITGLRSFAFLGERVVMPEGIPNPWIRVGEFSSLLLLVFVADASWSLWQRGNAEERRRAAVVGGSIVFFIVAAAGWAALIHAQVVQSPYVISVSFLAIVAAMGFELSYDVLRAAQITGRLQASEAALRESEQRMELATRAAKLGLWAWDIPRNRIWATAQTRAFFGFAATEPLNFERFIDTTQQDDQALVRDAVTRAFSNGGDYECDYRVVGPGAPKSWIAARGRVEFGKDGKPVLMRGVLLDITARKESEAELLEKRRELAHLSRVMMLGELSGSLAHELNQPLTAILSNAEAAQRFLEKGEMTELRDILDDIVTADKHAGEVISRLRLLLKKGEVVRLPLDVNDAVQDALKLMRSDLVNQGVMVEPALAPGLPAVDGDRVQLQQVLLNLVINACDAMADNDGADRRLLVCTECAPDGGARVAVADNGRGIPEGMLDRVFEPFFTTKAHGMGLGLSVCRTIIAAHGGELTAVNNAGRGATFHFTLPAVKSSCI